MNDFINDVIPRFPTEVAELVFNRCMVHNKVSFESSNYEITFNYEFLDDLYSILAWGEKGTSDSGSTSGNVPNISLVTSHTNKKTTCMSLCESIKGTRYVIYALSNVPHISLVTHHTYIKTTFSPCCHRARKEPVTPSTLQVMYKIFP